MKKSLTVSFLAFSLLLTACAGRTPDPVPQRQPGDEEMSCEQLKQNIVDNQSEIISLMPKQSKTGKNVALGAAGAFFVVPLFFMDFSDAERIEIRGLQLRNNWLRVLHERKKCKTVLPAEIKFADK